MKRNVSIEEISDGKLYTSNDLVKADCGGCRGCSVCCHGMGTSVILDPLDAVRLAEGLGRSVEELISLGLLELNVVDGIILPNLRMAGEDEACVFLNEEGRCSVHAYRPGICRLFPLGRYYHSGSGHAANGAAGFSYFLQVHECPYPAKTKVKVRKWIDTPDFAKYERYAADWHYFLEAAEKLVEEAEDDEQIRNINLYLLKFFYLKPYGGGQAENPAEQSTGAKPYGAEYSGAKPYEAKHRGAGTGSGAFYEEFYRRLDEAKNVLL